MGEPRPFAELSSSGLLWLINAVVFHPRGYALYVSADAQGRATGWGIQGDGSEPWYFEGNRDDKFAAAESTLRLATEENKPCRS